MSRPEKDGLLYFSFDVEKDNKLKLLKAKFGSLGFGVYVELLQYIYRNGYYVDWTDDNMLLFVSETGLKEEETKLIIEFMLLKGLFDISLYDKYNIITSSGIQKRYAEGTKKRKTTIVIDGYWVVGDYEHITKELKEGLTKEKEELTKEKEEKSTQSKVKQSKVKESNNILLEEFISTWNSIEKIGKTIGLPKTVKITEKIQKQWEKTIKDFTYDEIKLGARKYCIEIQNRKDDGSGYYEHRFTLLKFLEQSNGLEKFLNS